MFGKLSLMSFIYDMLETFCFPGNEVQKIFQKYMIERSTSIMCRQTLTSPKVLYVSYPSSNIPGSNYRNIIFEVIIASEVYNRFNSSDKYWQSFDARKGNLRKRLGYFEISVTPVS